IEKATSPFIAFLDADDYCLDQRFLVTERVFESNSKIDAVYEPIGVEFYSEKDKVAFCKWSGIAIGAAEAHITYPNSELSGYDLFYGFITGGCTFPSLDGLTVKRSALSRIEPFKENLRLHQDTEFLIRL